MNEAPFHPFCATCLSQGRKMYYMKYYSLPYLDLIRNFMLTENDRICWECHNFVLKMGAFRVKAWRAQNCLVALFNRQPTQLQSFSKLSRSSGMHLDISDCQEVQIKPEYDATVCDPLDFQNAKIERDEMIHFQVFQHTRGCFGEVRECQVSGVQPFEAMADGILMPQVITTPQITQTTPIQDNSFKIRLPYKPASERDTQLETEHSTTRINETSQREETEPQGPSFTEEILSEEEMAKWREGKRQAEFYLQSAPNMRCEKCVQPFFESKRWFRNHYRMHNENFGDLSCDICGLPFNDEETLMSHKKSHHRLLKCGFCELVWDHPNAMRIHCKEQHGVRITVWACDICLREVPPGKVAKHLRNHVTFVKCPECNQAVKRLYFKRHMSIHTRGAEKPYECECGRKFSDKYYLKRHMRVHSDKRDVNAFCATCNIQYRDMEAYNSHMKYSVKHISEERLKHQCEHCGKKCQTKSALFIHTEKHSKVKKYACDTCPATFKSKNSYRIHKKKHENGIGPKDKICDYCGKAFRSRAILIDHINSHTGWRPYKCDRCGDTFGHKSARYLHVRLKHLKIPRKKVKKTS